MLLETAVVFVLFPADVARVPEVVCGGWKDTWLRVIWGWGRWFPADWVQMVTPWRTVPAGGWLGVFYTRGPGSLEVTFKPTPVPLHMS